LSQVYGGADALTMAAVAQAQVQAQAQQVAPIDTQNVVDVTGTSKGHGTQGNIKRWGQSRGPETHGSRYHRIPGSMGSIINRVPKGKKLPGHMGGKQVTVQNLVIEKVVPEKNVLLIKGNVPGAKNSLIIVKSAVKAAK